MTDIELVKNIAQKIQEAGGTLFLVGGCVRDEFLNKDVKDYDCEVYNLSKESLLNIVKEFGGVDEVGESFQAFKLGQNIDIVLPRRDTKVGVGHKGFTTEADPGMSFKEACSRRDFTINAILKNPLTGEIIDPFNGRKDISNRILRVVSPNSFQEDSLRVLRLAQFASRFRFSICAETKRLAKETNLSDLPKERVWMELEKMFLKSISSAIGLHVLGELRIIEKLFPSLNITHWGYMRAMHNASVITVGMPDAERLAIMLTVLCWKSENIELALDEMGVTSVNGYNVRDKVLSMHNVDYKNLNSDYDYHLLALKVHMRLYAKVLKAIESDKAEKFYSTIKRLGIQESPMKPVMYGKHLIELGLVPSVEFGKILAHVYDEQLKGNVTTLEQAKNIAVVWQEQ